ncbi:MAG TPA: RbsD/FucU domain-containing protein [Paracoccaceae bacterium]|nr:RbsD/FucU domain-containing protein [Paracoccaceae bacterium]HMO73179.1 RbsD/FucU domain-containing protein [Paracoccaceae bacterium]
MLIGISPLVGPDLLRALAAMGHGDEIAFVDANYPAEEHARRLIRADGIGLCAMLEAVLPLFPLDHATSPILRTGEGNDPAIRAAIHDGLDALFARFAPRDAVRPLGGADFYPRVRAAHMVVATGERALYANVILRKGVIPP